MEKTAKTNFHKHGSVRTLTEVDFRDHRLYGFFALILLEVEEDRKLIT